MVQARAGYLKKHRWCVLCEAEGRKTEATEVDHIVPHKGDKRLFWDRRNWQSLCHSHHSAKTMAELHGREYRPKGNDEHGQARGRQMTDWFSRWGKA